MHSFSDKSILSDIHKLESTNDSIIPYLLQVSQLHGDLVEWMIRLLLVITKSAIPKSEEPAAKKVDSGEEEGEENDDKEPADFMEFRADLESMATLRDNYRPLADKMSHFTKRVTK